MLRTAAILLAVTLVAPAIAAAQHTGGSHTGGSHTGGGAGAGDPFSARYTEASRAWHDQRYDDALRLFSALYEETHRPELLYDLGLTYERLDRLAEAIDAFQRYVDALPMARNRMQVEDRLASLRDDLRERAPSEGAARGTATTIPRRATPRASERPIMSLLGSDAEDSRPEGTPAPRTETVLEGGGPEWIVTWPFLGLTALAGVITGVAWDQGYQALRVLEDECRAFMDCTPASIEGSSARAWETATNVLLVTTLVLGAATIVTFVAEAATPTEPREVQRPIASLRLDAGAGGLSLRGTF